MRAADCFLQVHMRHHQTSHQPAHSPAAMLWYYHGVLHPLQYSYTTLSQCGWPTLTVPVLLPSQCSIPPPLPSLSIETTSLPVQAHQSVISMCGVSLLSILLVVASLLTVLHLSQYHKVCALRWRVRMNIISEWLFANCISLLLYRSEEANLHHTFVLLYTYCM